MVNTLASYKRDQIDKLVKYAMLRAESYDYEVNETTVMWWDPDFPDFLHLSFQSQMEDMEESGTVTPVIMATFYHIGPLRNW
jgi:hypothetical protein